MFIGQVGIGIKSTKVAQVVTANEALPQLKKDLIMVFTNIIRSPKPDQINRIFKLLQERKIDTSFINNKKLTTDQKAEKLTELCMSKLTVKEVGELMSTDTGTKREEVNEKANINANLDNFMDKIALLLKKEGHSDEEIAKAKEEYLASKDDAARRKILKEYGLTDDEIKEILKFRQKAYQQELDKFNDKYINNFINMLENMNRDFMLENTQTLIRILTQYDGSALMKRELKEALEDYSENSDSKTEKIAKAVLDTAKSEDVSTSELKKIIKQALEDLKELQDANKKLDVHFLVARKERLPTLDHTPKSGRVDEVHLIK